MTRQYRALAHSAPPSLLLTEMITFYLLIRAAEDEPKKRKGAEMLMKKDVCHSSFFFTGLWSPVKKQYIS